MASALYIHIPFCTSKCPYCAFVSVANEKTLITPYMKALRADLERQAQWSVKPLTTIYIGGGTPTVLPAEYLEIILEDCHKLYQVVAETEITIEANPGSADEAKLRKLRTIGVNRLSLGVQSLQDEELASLGRGHRARSATEAFTAARSAGFTDISIDLMTGIPGQTPKSWDNTLETALRWQPEHCSIYELTVEENTPLHASVRENRVSLPDEESRLAMDRLSLARTAAAGLMRYEIANYARTGKQCRHNLSYWHNLEYIGVGAGAVSCLGGVRERRTADVATYIRRVWLQDIVIERECLDHEASFRETIILGLRLTLGVSRSKLLERYGIDMIGYYGNILERLMAAGMLCLVGDQLRLTARGRPIANRILSELV